MPTLLRPEEMRWVARFTSILLLGRALTPISSPPSEGSTPSMSSLALKSNSLVRGLLPLGSSASIPLSTASMKLTSSAPAMASIISSPSPVSLEANGNADASPTSSAKSPPLTAATGDLGASGVGKDSIAGGFKGSCCGGGAGGLRHISGRLWYFC